MLQVSWTIMQNRRKIVQLCWNRIYMFELGDVLESVYMLVFIQIVLESVHVGINVLELAYTLQG